MYDWTGKKRARTQIPRAAAIRPIVLSDDVRVSVYKKRSTCILSKDVPNQITNFNVKETNNPEMRHTGTASSAAIDRVFECVCVCVACSSHFHISTSAAASNDKTTKRQNDRLYFVSVFALFSFLSLSFHTCRLVDAFADIHVYQLITAQQINWKRKKTQNELTKKTRARIHMNARRAHT